MNVEELFRNIRDIKNEIGVLEKKEQYQRLSMLPGAIRYDKDKVQVKGAVLDRMAEQVGEVIAKRIDQSLIAEMDENAVYKTPTAQGDDITPTEIEAGLDVFGDQVDDDSRRGDTIAGVLVGLHPQVRVALAAQART